MKKIISTVLSLLMLLSTFGGMSAMACENNLGIDFDTPFASYMGENFNDNFYHIAILNGGESVTAEYVGVRFSTESETELDLTVAKYGAYYEKFENMTDDTMPVGKDKSDIKIKKDTPVEFYVGMGSMALLSNHGIYGIALDNASALENDEKVKVELFTSPIDINAGTYDSSLKETKASCDIEFKAPVSFVDAEALNDFAAVLTDLKFGKDIDAEDVEKALNSLATDEENLTTNIEKLDDKLTNEWIVKLADTLKKNTLSVNSTTYNYENVGDITVTMPWAALAGEVSENTKVYAPIVSAGTTKPSKYEGNANDKELLLNISLGATENDVTTEISTPMVKQRVEVTLPNGWDLSNDVYVYHGNDEPQKATVEQGKAVFYTNSFSDFLITGSPVVENVNAKATKAKFVVEQDETNKNVFTLKLVPTEGEQIVRFLSAEVDVQFKKGTNPPENVMENCTFDLVPENGIAFPEGYTLVEKDNTTIGGFNVIAVAKDADNEPMTGAEIKLAKITVKGTGSFQIRAVAEGNKVMTETTENNVAIEIESDENSWSPSNTEYFEIPEIKYDLKFNLTFENQIIAKKADEIKMNIVLENALSGEKYNVVVGKSDTPEADVTYLPLYTVEKTDKNGYTYDIATTNNNGELPSVELPGNVRYNFEISGLGYRTFRGSVYLDEAKTLNIWNNAIDDGNLEKVIDDDDTTKKTVTFLVGDIYEDGIVDIYDLSAVTAYYNHNVAEDKDLAYDLNRDGKIDIVDIGYVQASYGY